MPLAALVARVSIASNVAASPQRRCKPQPLFPTERHVVPSRNASSAAVFKEGEARPRSITPTARECGATATQRAHHAHFRALLDNQIHQATRDNNLLYDCLSLKQ